MSQQTSQVKNPRLLGIVKLHLVLETVTGLLISAGRQMGRIGGADASNVLAEKVYECKDQQGTQQVMSGTRTYQRQDLEGKDQQGKDRQSNQQSFLIRVPYIPGSSIKGRMRSLLELAKNLELFSTDGKIWMHVLSPKVRKSINRQDVLSYGEFLEKLRNSNTTFIFNKLFGMPSIHVDDFVKNLGKEINDESKAEQETAMLINSLSQTSLLISDFFPACDYVCGIYNTKGLVTLEDFLEEKSENRIDRITSAADPRTIERVKPHVKFEGDFTLLVFDNSKNHLEQYMELIAEGLQLLESTYLGAAGSRGYGRIMFKSIEARLIYPREEDVGKYKSVGEFKNEITTLSKEILNKLGAQGQR